VFDTAIVTHLHTNGVVNITTILERHEKEIKKLKHEHGSMHLWL